MVPPVPLSSTTSAEFFPGFRVLVRSRISHLKGFPNLFLNYGQRWWCPWASMSIVLPHSILKLTACVNVFTGHVKWHCRQRCPGVIWQIVYTAWCLACVQPPKRTEMPPRQGWFWVSRFGFQANSCLKVPLRSDHRLQSPLCLIMLSLCTTVFQNRLSLRNSGRLVLFLCLTILTA